MRVRRRVAFAAPFVLIAGCKHPAPVDPAEDERTREEETPVVVAIPHPLDAAIADAPEPDAAIADAAVVSTRPPRPPKPECCVNPPAARLVRVINVAVQTDRTAIVIATGTDEGVAVGNVDVRVARRDSMESIPNGEVTLTSCSARACKGTVKLTPDQLNMTLRVIVRWK